MSQIFVQGASRMAFDGVAKFATDGASAGTPIAFADQRIAFVKDSNNSYPDLIDGSAYPVNKVPGYITGAIQVSGVVQPDRSFHTFLNTAFGPRTAGQLPPWFMNLVPYNGGAPIKACGIWWDSIRIFSQFSVQGGGQMVMFQLNGSVCDPNNVLGAPTLTTPSYVGTAGAGIAAFSTASFTDDSTGVYDLIRSFDIALSNRGQVQPAGKSGQTRMVAGWTPGTIAGALTLAQLLGAVTPIPQSDGTYPITLPLPTGDASHALKIATSMSYDRAPQSYSPSDFNTVGASYSLFSTSAGATSTAAWPFVASYA